MRPGALQSGMAEALPLHVEFEVSRLQRAFIVASHALTLALLALLPLPWGMAPSLALLVVAWGLRAWQRLPPAALVVRLDATLVLLWRNGVDVHAALCNGGYVGGWFTTIVWQEAGRRRRHALLVTPDMLDADAYRRLRVHLRYASSGSDQDEPDSQACASTSAPLSALDCPAIR
jgi:hypothetical protein